VGGGAGLRRLSEDSFCEEGWPWDVAVTCTKVKRWAGVKEGGKAESLPSPVVLHLVLLPHVTFSPFSVHISMCLHLIDSQRLPATVFLPIPTPPTAPTRSVATPEAEHPSPLAPLTQRGDPTRGATRFASNPPIQPNNEPRSRRDPLLPQPTPQRNHGCCSRWFFFHCHLPPPPSADTKPRAPPDRHFPPGFSRIQPNAFFWLK